MTVSLKHSTVVLVPDDGTSPVGSDEWNAEHSLTLAADRVLGRLATSGAAQELASTDMSAFLALGSGGGTTNFLRADGAWVVPPGSSGNVGNVGTPINGQIAQWTTATTIQGISGTTATGLLDIFSSTLKGLAPASGGGTTNFLRADGTWNVPAGGGNVSNSGTPTSGQFAQWTSATVIQGVSAGALTKTDDTNV